MLLWIKASAEYFTLTYLLHWKSKPYIYRLTSTLYYTLHSLVCLLQPTSCILVDDGDRLPFVELHDVQHRPADRGVVRVEVDVEAVLVVHGRVLPAGLDVGHLQCVADGLDGADRGAVRRAKYGRHTQGQLITGWGRDGGVQERTERKKKKEGWRKREQKAGNRERTMKGN